MKRKYTNQIQIRSRRITIICVTSLNEQNYVIARLSIMTITSRLQSWYEYFSVHPERNLVKPVVSLEDDVIYASAGDTVVIRCSATGIPIPMLEWIKETGPLPHGKSVW